VAGRKDQHLVGEDDRLCMLVMVGVRTDGEVFLSPRRDAKAARRLFTQAIGRTRISPVEVTTDRYRVYPRVLDELLPAASHDSEAHAHNPIETDHGRLKARLRPIRGLKIGRFWVPRGSARDVRGSAAA